ncbi:gamma-glutamyltransferase family protein [Dermacoccus sp. 147Ba]|uniref:gamma-glutamyltransferase family protein n=1 Tax=unclassified Dermacoccus TaxID=2643059 RepID=UPI000641EA30|nr:MULTISPECIES: gamma-glutamyltransferase [unclassified Dermacoccus]KLO61786.1 gamma-glutamyltransferase [Dermacoccus sp. PE3]RYI20617.1 gamma-glutamyltransferase family protein [Dermacoccus sp. 147Ba]
MTTRPEMWGDRGVVASTHWLASAAGSSMLDRGGNAFDAVVATGLVLHVVEPHLNGLGGDLAMLVHDGASGTTRAICGQGPMPATATIGHFEGLGLDHVPASGLLAATVPGAFGAWMRMLEEYGRLPLREVVEPAIDHARAGVPLLPKAAEMIAAVAPVFTDHWPTSASVYLRSDGTAPIAGERLRNAQLADTLERLCAEGYAKGRSREGVISAARDAFYRGFVAEVVDRHVTSQSMLDSTGDHHRGLLTGDDMAGWHPGIEETATYRFGDCTVHKSGPWTQGPVFLQQLALLDGTELARTDFLGPDHLHLVIEAAKLAFADREAWYGDPIMTANRTAELLAAGYNAKRRTLIGDHACGELRPGSLAGVPGRLPRIPLTDLEPTDPAWLTQLREGIPVTVAKALEATRTNGDTCTAVAADAEGNMVAATPSGGWLKSSPVLPGLGFALGTRGQMAWLDADHPNALAPGKRPRTTLSPTIVERDGRAELAFGTPGGDQQDQWTLQAFLAHAVFGRGLQEAVESPQFHTNAPPTSFAPRRSMPTSVSVEPGITDSTITELRRRGHDVRLAPARSLGKVCMAAVTSDGCRGAASPNGAQAYAIAT